MISAHCFFLLLALPALWAQRHPNLRGHLRFFPPKWTAALDGTEPTLRVPPPAKTVGRGVRPGHSCPDGLAPGSHPSDDRRVPRAEKQKEEGKAGQVFHGVLLYFCSVCPEAASPALRARSTRLEAPLRTAAPGRRRRRAELELRSPEPF